MKSPWYLSSKLAVIIIGLGIVVGSGQVMAQRALGIDVSSDQGGSINWASVSNAGISFAWAKATQGNYYIDADFAINEANARAAGVLIGAYDFADYNTDFGTNGAVTEANYFWNEAGNYIKAGGSYIMPMLDVELSPSGYNEITLSQWVNQWCTTVSNKAAAAGVTVRPVIYTGISFASDWLNNSVTQWPLWMANPQSPVNPQTGGPNATSPWSTWNFWQYGQATIPGVTTGVVDEDVFNGSATALQSYVISDTVPPPPTTLYWDGDKNGANNNAGTGAGLGASTMSGAGVNWTGSGVWWDGSSGSDENWVSAATAYFWGTNSGTVTLANGGGNQTCGGLVFRLDGYAINRTGSSVTLTLTGSPPIIQVYPACAATVSCPLAGSGGYRKASGGRLTLTSTANTIAGTANITGGTLELSSSGCLGSGITNVDLADGATLQNDDATSGDSFVSSSTSITLTGSTATAALNVSAAVGSLTFAGTASVNISGATAGFTKTGPGALVISGNQNTYAGPTVINQGTLSIGLDRSSINPANLGEVPSSFVANNITLGGGVLSANNNLSLHPNRGIQLTANSTLDVGTQQGAGQTMTVPAAVSQFGGSYGITKTSNGILLLTGVNTYSGDTIISAGTLALGATGSINSSSTLGLAAGSTFDVSAIASYTLSSNTTLSANGAAAPATINGGTTISLGAQPIVLACDGSHPALIISQGVLSLNGNAFTVNGPQLAGGSAYTIVQQASGNITSAGSCTVSGTAIGAASTTAAISVSGGNVVLTIANITTTTLSALSASTYGQLVAFTATVAPAPSGGTVQFYDNGVALGSPVPVSGGTATYGINSLSIGNHPITAFYSGTTGYAASATAGASTQQVTLPPNSAPVLINSAARLGDGTLKMTFTGIPGYTYVIQATASLNPPITWTNLSTNMAGTNGLFNFVDMSATNDSDRYYRTAIH